jgi:transmembrane sensor
MKPKTDFEDHLFKNLGAYQSIDVAEDWQKVRKRMSQDKSIRLQPFWRVAAAVILLVGLGFIAQKYLAPAPEMMAVLAGDQMKEVSLPDGSLVTLNKQARLVYPEKFKGRQRALSLSGEAFFEVVSNPEKPFIVDVEQEAVVTVLGTSFNIRSKGSGELISVQVLEGRVSFSSLESPDEIILVKDEQATLSKGTVTRDNEVDRNMLSWKTGKLFFENTRISDVLNQLQSHYQIKMELDKSVPEDLSFTSILDNQELESVLDELSLVLGLVYRIENDQVIFTKTE